MHVAGEPSTVYKLHLNLKIFKICVGSKLFLVCPWVPCPRTEPIGFRTHKPLPSFGDGNSQVPEYRYQPPPAGFPDNSVTKSPPATSLRPSLWCPPGYNQRHRRWQVVASMWKNWNFPKSLVGVAILKKSLAFSYIVQDTPSTLLGTYPREIKYVHRKICVEIFTGAWFIIAQHQEQSRSPLTEARINSIDTVKRNILLTPVTTRVNLQNIVLSDRCQTKACMILLISNLYGTSWKGREKGNKAS